MNEQYIKGDFTFALQIVEGVEQPSFYYIRVVRDIKEIFIAPVTILSPSISIYCKAPLGGFFYRCQYKCYPSESTSFYPVWVYLLI